MNYQPELYPWLIKNGKLSWGMSYNLSNTRRRAGVLSRGMYYTNAPKLNRIAHENPADVVVSVHSVLTRPSMQAYLTLDRRPPFLTVVTDLVSTHMFWYEKQSELCMVPTQEAYERGLACGMRPEQMKITGLPVHPRFAEQLTSKEEARKELRWHPHLPAVLMVAGGEGMGPIYETARAINALSLNCQLVIVAGKNRALHHKLANSEWNQMTHIYPYVTNMPRLMAAADILVTKAGPATISEACIAGLPMIISDYIPGQEDGNVTFVVENNAGVYAPKPELVAREVTKWLAEGKRGLMRRAANARQLARPNAVWDIADEVWRWAQHPRIPVEHKSLLDDLADKTRQFVSI
jgi:1,2-diacylglycerol 3-beta-galactosyltransferase